MAIEDDFSIDSITKNIRVTGGSTNYPVIDLHRWLASLSDNAISVGDDHHDITDTDASDRSTDVFITLLSPYNIDDTAAQRFYDGTIVQSDGDERWDGIVNYGVSGIHIELIQDGALLTPNFWTTGINPDAVQGISHRFLVKVRTAGADIDNRSLIGTAREFGYTFAESKIPSTQEGNNVLVLTHSVDLNNDTAEGTVAGWTTIANTEGYRAIDVDANGSDEYFYSEWDKSTYTIKQFYERMKWLTRRGTSSSIYGLSGDLFRGITHEIVVDNPSATDFSTVEPVSWTGGTGQMLAINDVNAPTKMWIQLLTGVAPTDGLEITGGTSGATCDVDTTVTERAVAPTLPFIGACTGTAIIGNYGVGIEAADLTASDKLFDLDNIQKTPPNNVTFNVFGTESGEDRVLVGPRSGGILEKDQLSLNTTLDGASETAIVLTTAIPSDTPSSGTLRVVLDSGVDRYVEYTSWTGSTFTIASSDWTDPADATSGNNVYLTYIDKTADASSVSYTCVYSGADRPLLVRSRDGGVTPTKPFEVAATLGSSGGAVTVIRTSDE
jgi:hypothetical protein